MATSSNQQLFDMFLLGMTWLRDDRPDVLARPGSSVFSALALAGVINEGQRRLLARNTGLVTVAMKNGDIIKGSKRPPKRQLESRIAESNKYLLTLVTDSLVQYDKLFGSRGYQHIITDEGMAHARSLAGQYNSLLDEAKFMRGWEVFKTQMRAKNARNPQSRGRTTSESVIDEDEAGIHITKEAPYSEADFEW